MTLGIEVQIANMDTAWNAYSQDAYNGKAQFIALGEAIEAQNWTAAKTQCNNLASNYGQSIQDHWWSIATNTAHRWLREILVKINNEWPTGGTVNMDSILNAMLAADYDQLLQFVGIEEAYRMAVWDQPFNKEFYASLARGFRP